MAIVWTNHHYHHSLRRDAVTPWCLTSCLLCQDLSLLCQDLSSTRKTFHIKNNFWFLHDYFLDQVLVDMIQDNGEPPKKKLYELKLSLIDEIGWAHLASYERQWMLVRFPPSLPLFWGSLHFTTSCSLFNCRLLLATVFRSTLSLSFSSDVWN